MEHNNIAPGGCMRGTGTIYEDDEQPEFPKELEELLKKFATFKLPEIKWLKVHPDAQLPKLAHPDPLTGDSGYDLFAVEKTHIPCMAQEHAGKLYIPSAVVPVGIEVAYITPGYWFKIEAKSGLGFKYSLMPHFGVIDNSYRGGLGVKIYNLSNQEFIYNKGDKVAQITLHKLIHANMSWSDTKHETQRHDKGFGSTGK